MINPSFDKISETYLVCDICNKEELPSNQIIEQIENRTFSMEELPFHCSNQMRITILEKPIEETYFSLVDIDSLVWTVIEIVKLSIENNTGNTDLANNIGSKIQSQISENHQSQESLIFNLNDLIDNILSENLDDESLKINLLKVSKNTIENKINNAKSRFLHKDLTYSGPILPGSLSSHDLQLLCNICHEIVKIDENEKSAILESDDEIALPQHHGQPVRVKIIPKDDQKQESHSSQQPKTFNPFVSDQIEKLEIKSVGIDIGSSTTHLIFSNLHLRREVGFMNMTNRFNIVKREIVYESEIINTPLIDERSIDIDLIIDFCLQQYETAGIAVDDIDTGAVIITGETAKKSNAKTIVQKVSNEAGKFVSAVAGPNLESLLGAMGSGAVAISKEKSLNILNVDIGGGTSNLALISNGTVISTSCINVGGRLLGIDEDFRIWRIDEPTRILMKYLDMDYQLYDIISEKDVRIITKTYADVLIEVMKGPTIDYVSKALMMTSDIDFSNHPIDGIIFSGGIAEMIYGDVEFHQDIGSYLASYLKSFDFGIEIIEPLNKIRATVIGVGSYSVSISGSTISFDNNIEFPISNIPVLEVDVDRDNFSKEYLKTGIEKVFANFDMTEGEEIVALYFNDPIWRRDMFLMEFVEAIEESLTNSIKNNQLIILVFNSDVGGTIGMTLKRQTKITKNFVCLDEIELHTGDWIDIGMPIGKGDVFPVTIKSLVFN